MPPFTALPATMGVPSVARTLPAVRNYVDGNAGFYPHPYYIIGVTKDNTGAPLGSCVLVLFRTADNSIAALGLSDASGNYVFVASPALTHYLVAYKSGSPDVAGTTVNTLIGI
jgi:hypothetical protein